MQKIFTKYISLVVVAALLMILGMNWGVQEHNARKQMVKNSRIKLDQVAQTLETNEVELENLKESLNEDYLTRAYAFAYIIKQNPDVLNSQEELTRIAQLLNVDELHVIDENGILYAGSIPLYFGMDFNSTDQTREFLEIMDHPDSFLVQDIRPNGYEQKVFQYIGVARQDKKGIVQVGMAPTRMLAAQSRNQLDYIMNRVPLDNESTLFAVDQETGEILSHSDESLKGKNMKKLGFTEENLKEFQDGAFTKAGGKKSFCVAREYDGLILGVSQTTKALYSERNLQILLTYIFLLFVCMILILVINRLLKKQIVDGIHTIMGDLAQITDGNLNTVVKVDSNPEFAELSSGINKMVQGILDATVKVSKVIDIVDLPIGVFEYGEENNLIIATDRLRMVMGWSEEEAEKLYTSRERFTGVIERLMDHPEEGETDIYELFYSLGKWVKIQMNSDGNKTFGVVTDVTEDMLEKRKIQRERDYDLLTGLCNIEVFKKEVEERLRKNHLGCAAVIMMDLDNFKGINDNYGHDWGDEYLRCCGRHLKNFNGDHGIAARRSGDEFCIFLHHYSEKMEITGRIREFYDDIQNDPILFPDGSVHTLKISAGLAWYSEKLPSCSTLLKAADYALYDSKNSGKGMLKEYSL